MRAMLRNFTPADWLGVAGSLAICAAYLAVSEGVVAADRPLFHVINGSGSIMLLISLWFRPNPGAILIEVLWLAIALWSLSKIFFIG